MLTADMSKDYSANVLAPTAEMGLADLAKRFKPLVRGAREDLKREGFRAAQQRIQRLVDVRYVGQSYELTVPFAQEYRRRFDAQHHRTYGYSNPARATEVVAIRVVAIGVRPRLKLPFRRPRRSFVPECRDWRPARFGSRTVRAAFYRSDALEPGAGAKGAAVIASPEATVVIPPGWQFQIDGFGNVIATGPRPKAYGTSRRTLALGPRP
jgi:N-methylhydantoinase A